MAILTVLCQKLFTLKKHVIKTVISNMNQMFMKSHLFQILFYFLLNSVLFLHVQALQ
jgi:hypothetical protein